MKKISVIYTGSLCLVACLLFSISCDADEKNKLSGRTYYISVPEKPVDSVLLVWCHPSGGDAQPEFDWWKIGKITKEDVILLCPQSKGRTWSIRNDALFMKKLIVTISKKYGIDKKKVILGGHSSGGVFTYSFGLRNQTTFRYIIPACGMIQKRPSKPMSKNMTIMIYHSKNDSVFSFKNAKTTESALIKMGYEVAFTEDNIGHSIGPQLGKLVKTCVKELHK